MSQEQAPALESRYILRRIHKSRCTETEPIQVMRGGFCPSSMDEDGLSVYFADQVKPAVLAANAAKPHECYVVCIPLQAVFRLGFTVIAREDSEGPPGHAIIPELSIQSYEADKKRWKPLQEELARIATENIVHRPSDPLPPVP